jgi:hypothetical protein
VNLSLEVSNLIVSVQELNLVLLQLLTPLPLILKVLDLLGLNCLEILKLPCLSDGGILCLVQEAVVSKYLLVMLGRAMVDGQELLVLVTNMTLKSPQLLAQGTVVLGHMPDLLLRGFNLPCISIETMTLSNNNALGVVLQMEQVLGISSHVCPTTVVVVLKDIARLFNAYPPLRIRVVLDQVQ